MKICFIGEVGHYGYVLEGMKQLPACEVVGVAPGSATESVDRLHARLKELGHDTQRFEDYETMLDTAKPDIAVVCSVFNLHAEISIQALNKGVHVFAEKPIATSGEDLELLRQAFETSGKSFMPMFGMRYTAPFLTAWNEVRDGRIGTVRMVHVQKSYKLGERDEFYKKRDTYGGTLSWVGSHAIDLAYWFSGERFESVLAQHSSVANRQHGELEVSGFCQFRMTHEVIATVSVDYFRPATASSHADDRIRVVGTEGVIEVREGAVYLTNGEQRGEQSVPLLAEEQIFVDFVNHVQATSSGMLTTEDGFVVTDACLKATASADQGKVVYFD